jgi:tetratricopeptide (TPR) repeat protein
MRLAWTLACLAMGTALAADEFASFPAVYEQLEIEQRVAAGGSLEETRRATVRIQSDTGAQWAAQILIPLSREDADVQVVSAGVRDSNGAERALDPAQLRELPRDGSPFRAWAVPDLHSGDRIVSEVRVRYPAAESGRWWANLAPAFDLPVIAGQWTVRMPPASEINFNLLHTEGHRETEPGVHVWQLANSPAQASPPPWFALSTFNTWNEVADWLRSRQPVADAAWLRQQAADLFAADSNADALQTLYLRVAQGVQLLDEPLASSRFRAASPRQTWTAGEGNAYSKHVLLAALLATRDIPCDAVFVAASPLDTEFPSPGQFERVISAAPEPPAWLWLDPSWGVARPGALPPELRGRSALVVSDRGSRIMRIPAAPAGLNRARATWKGEVRATGDAFANLRVELQGDAEVALRQAFLLGDAAGQLRELLAHVSGYQSRTARAAVDVFDLRGPFAIEMQLGLPNLLPTLTRRSAADFRVFKYGRDCHCSNPVQSTLLDPPFSAQEEFELRLPPEFRPILPPPASWKSPAGAIDAFTAFQDNLLRISRRVSLAAAPETGDRSFDTAIELDSRRSQVFERTGAIDVEAALKDEALEQLDRKGYDALETDLPLARVYLEYTTRKFPESRYSWNNLGRVYAAYGMREEALAAYDRQIQVNPQDKWAYDNRGRLLSNSKRDREAIGWFQRQLEIDPEDFASLRDLGHSYLELGQREEAEPYLRHALELQPDSWQVLEDLAVMQACRGRIEEAKPRFLKAFQHCPAAGAIAAAWDLAGCGAALDYALSIARGLLGQTEEMFDATRDLADWRAGVSAQQLLAAQLAAIGRTLLRMRQPKPAAEALRTAAALVADEDLLLELRDASIALGDWKGAAQAHVDAQALAGDRRLDVPAAIAAAVEQAAPSLDADGWKRLPLRPAAGAQGMPERQLPLACSVSAAGAAEACTLLDPDTTLQEAAARDAARATFPRVNWRGKDEPATRLIRLTYGSGGRVEAQEAVTPQAAQSAGLLMPEAPRRQDGE